MKKVMMLVTVCVISLIVTSCESDPKVQPWCTTVLVDTSYRIHAVNTWTRVFLVYLPEAGDFTVTIDDLTTDCCVTVFEYIASAQSIDDLCNSQPNVKVVNQYLDNTSEMIAYTADVAKYIYLFVDSWGELPEASYTLMVSSPTGTAFVGQYGE